ncbi:hypothetical protein C1645_744904 [Glomus cerebriforme]|uniref:Uncharacterized protein n=1 Tax=Glomus cerebriforme TaxID=658196 RepID=A0A397SET1_9GLOM|nr:hypothetical protein C1645_744904 [Glomus cerebriforme]
MGDYCSPCWDKEKTRYEVEIKNGNFKIKEVERERETKNGLTITEKDGERIKICSECKNKGGEKCADCQTEKNPNELLTIQVQGKDIKICAECKQKRDNELPPRDDNQIPPKGSCAKCKKKCEMFDESKYNLDKNNIHCPKCGKDLAGKDFYIRKTIAFGKYSTEIDGFRVSCGSKCPTEKAEREAIVKENKNIQEKYKSATVFLSQLKDKLLNPREGTTAYNTGSDKV